jgi:hypothetical protein
MTTIDEQMDKLMRLGVMHERETRAAMEAVAVAELERCAAECERVSEPAYLMAERLRGLK